jgi:hypothetical protein
MVGTVLGSVALVGILGALLWFFRRRRRNRRESYLTPLTTNDEKTFYEIDNGSVASNGNRKLQSRYRPQSTVARLKDAVLEFGASFKSKVLPRSSTPNVNLDRGNSQFLDGRIPQHSRSNSTQSQLPRLTTKDRFNDWWDRFTDNLSFNRRLRNEPQDPFAAARNINDQARSATSVPDFSQLLNMDERGLQLETERRRAFLSNSVTASNLGSLGLDFASNDPFADPQPQSQAQAKNPFADPITQPGPTIPRTQTYIADIRRSRGQSVDLVTTNQNTSAYAATAATYKRPPSTAVTSRYPSTIAPSRDSYRDTVFSTFSSNVRKGKGRSDPFDLERPELWQIKDPPEMPKMRIASELSDMRGSAVPGPLAPRVVSTMPEKKERGMSTATYGSKYSSGVSSLGGWGDPGPDIGSQPSSLREGYGTLADAMQREGERGGSPNSDVSSRFGVGKAR